MHHYRKKKNKDYHVVEETQDTSKTDGAPIKNTESKTAADDDGDTMFGFVFIIVILLAVYGAYSLFTGDSSSSKAPAATQQTSSSSSAQKETQKNTAGNKQKESDVEAVAKAFTSAFLSNNVEGVRQTTIYEKKLYTVSMEQSVNEFSHIVMGSLDLYAKSRGLDSNIQYGITSINQVDDTHAQFNIKLKTADNSMTFYKITARKTKSGWKVDYESFLTSFMEATGQM